MTDLTQEANAALNFLCTAGAFGSTTLTTKDLRSLMLYTGGTLMSRGRLYQIKQKSLGAGVYRLTLGETR